MYYCINLLHDGFLPALFGFLLWSLPGALGMYGLSIGVSNIGESLPRAVYALLSGLNAATVGIIVLVAVQLSEKAITDKITCILVFLGASAGMMYNALCNGHEEYNAGAGPSGHGKDSERSSQGINENGTLPLTEQEASTAEDQSRRVPQERHLNISWKFGVLLIVLFLLSFIVVMVLRGPNFNFAVYLGSLTAINGGYNSAAGAILGFLGIFVPALLTVHGTMGIWGAIRGWIWVKSSLRGVNAAAVGLIYTAVYRLWQIGHIDEGFQQGTSLAVDPWWVVVTATSYVGGYWFRVSPPVAIGTGAVMGLIWYGVVSD
ncbi:hypothetical protein ACKAV7_014090 [Fusarium commune]